MSMLTRVCRRWRGRFLLGAVILGQATGMALTGWGADLAYHAGEYRKQLVERVLPYWFDTAQDRERGGYLLADDWVKGRGEAKEKQLVTQSRMVWGFSHAHLKRLGDGKRDYLQAARQGYQFLQGHFLDRQNGGYYWKTDLAGKPLVDCKFLYGEAFVVYAFVEYYRASGDREALVNALELYRTIQRHTHDAVNGGWVEHTESDWRAMAPGDPRNEVEVVGLRSANAHLHWMEALAELYQATRDGQVRASLAEALEINRKHFYPADPAKACFHRRPDWGEVTDPKSAGLSYGHNVEFAWLMVRAQQVLGERPDWRHFDAHVEHALRHGYDELHGGLFHRGVGNERASDTDKIWWVQAEMMAALTDGALHRKNTRREAALDRLIHFVDAHMTDPKDGIWVDTVTADGKPKATGKAHNWKANYHDVRALVKFVEAFDQRK